jgi:hypothetical protein
MVKRRLEQAGLNPAEFNAGALPWGERVPNSPFISHKDKLYLQTVFLKAGNVAYYECFPELVDRPYYPIEKENIIGLSDKTGSEHQGLERSNQVIVRTYCIDSIMAIRAMGAEIENFDNDEIAIWAADPMDEPYL